MAADTSFDLVVFVAAALLALVIGAAVARRAPRRLAVVAAAAVVAASLVTNAAVTRSDGDFTVAADGAPTIYETSEFVSGPWRVSGQEDGEATSEDEESRTTSTTTRKDDRRPRTTVAQPSPTTVEQAEPAAPPEPHVINSNGLFLFDTRSGDARQFAAGHVYFGEQSWAPDKRRVAYATAAPGMALMVLDVRTGTQRSILKADDARWHAWSPTDDVLALPGRLIDLEGEVLATFPQGSNPELSWSPDGKRVAFLNDRLHLALFDVETKKTTVVYDGGVLSFGPSWLPTGDGVVFFDEELRMAVFDLTTGQVQVLTETMTAVQFARVSHSGDHVRTCEFPTNKNEIASYDLRQGARSQIALDACLFSEHRQSGHLAMNREVSERFEYGERVRNRIVLQLDDGGEREVARGGTSADGERWWDPVHVSWRPGSDQLLVSYLVHTRL